MEKLSSSPRVQTTRNLQTHLVETLQAIEGHTKQLVGEKEKPNQAETTKPPTLYEETIEIGSNQQTEHSLQQTHTQKEKQDE